MDEHGGDGGHPSTDHEHRRMRPGDEGKTTRKAADRSDLAATVILLGRLTGLGWYVAASIAGGAIAGHWLDGQFQTGPALTIAGLAVGIAVAGVGVSKLLHALGGSRRGRDDQKRP